MISKLWAIESPSFSPSENLAAEAVLTGCAAPGAAILFLWQNEKTVVIGKNQNPWKECRLEPLFRDKGTVVRRLSGGGAVYHDLGNLNVSFCVSRQEEDIPRQAGIILNALGSLGVQASRSGRNDLEIDGKKFSGHAFYRQGACSCHHATLMLRVDREALEKYLSVSPLKLRSRGVDSVRARVANLAEEYPALTLPALRADLIDAFGREYGRPVETVRLQDFLSEEKTDRLRTLQAQFSSWEWTFGRRLPFDLEDAARFPWGEAEVLLRVDGGHILDCKCYTDAMDPLWTEGMEQALRGIRFTPPDIRAAFSSLSPALEPGMGEDLENMLVKMAEE